MNKLISLRRRLIPDYAVIQYLICAVGLCIAYYFTRFVNFVCRDGIDTYTDLTTRLDGMIPAVPLWTVVYFLSYVFWIVSYLWVSRESREMSNRLLFSDILGKLFCTVVYIAFPTTSSRPSDFGEKTGAWMLEMLYTIDMQDNLFPSMHCSVSWFAMRYVLKCRKIPVWYKVFSVFATLAVFAAVLFTKQHVIVDIFGGIAVAELSVLICERTGAWKIYDRFDMGKFYERRK